MIGMQLEVQLLGRRRRHQVQRQIDDHPHACLEPSGRYGSYESDTGLQVRGWCGLERQLGHGRNGPALPTRHLGAMKRRARRADLTKVGNARASAWSSAFVASWPSGTAQTVGSTMTSSEVVLRTCTSDWMTAPATNVVLGRRRSRNTPGTGSPAANVV